MLRIIAGKYRGRTITTTKHFISRPTMGVVREAIFNILPKSNLYNRDILDLFCGSGSFSFEALSQGAKHAFMVDSNYYHLQLPNKTAERLGITDNVTLIHCMANKLPKAVSQCSVVFIDPPYNSDLLHFTLKNLPNSGWLSDGAIVILEMKKNKPFQCDKKFSIILERTYCTSKVIFLSPLKNSIKNKYTSQ